MYALVVPPVGPAYNVSSAQAEPVQYLAVMSNFENLPSSTTVVSSILTAQAWSASVTTLKAYVLELVSSNVGSCEPAGVPELGRYRTLSTSLTYIVQVSESAPLVNRNWGFMVTVDEYVTKAKQTIVNDARQSMPLSPNTVKHFCLSVLIGGRQI